MIDLRSDTVTRPTDGMLKAMYQAEVGDDVYGEDPTINELQERIAAMFGHEAALFFPSGTMANQAAISVYCRPGDEVICDRLAHIYNYEGGGIARNSGATSKLLDGDRGRFKPEQVIDALSNPLDAHGARSRLVSVEDTCNKGGGSCWEVEDLKSIARICTERQLGYHLDGARVFNALVRRSDDPSTYGPLFDSISICLSKGLGTPVGSVLLGQRDFIREAHRSRKVFGGGMRQAGFLAAAGLYALDNHIDRLNIDHERAKLIAEKLNECGFVEDIYPVETNIVIFSCSGDLSSAELIEDLKEQGILAVPFGPRHVRMVTHLDISEGDMKYLMEKLPLIREKIHS